MIKIVLIDDQASVLQGLKMRFALETDLAVLGVARNGLEALKIVPALEPDVVVMDVEMPQMDGIAATRHLRETMPELGIVMLSIHSDPATREQARAAGATAFVEKQGAFETLLDAVHLAAEAS